MSLVVTKSNGCDTFNSPFSLAVNQLFGRTKGSAPVSRSNAPPMVVNGATGLQAAYIDLVTYSGQQYRRGKASLRAKPALVVQMEREGGDWHDALNAFAWATARLAVGPSCLNWRSGSGG